MARHQQARSLELRAATSLSRLWHDQAADAEAGSLLAEVLGQLGEGFTTDDYLAARTLLHEIGDRRPAS